MTYHQLFDQAVDVGLTEPHQSGNSENAGTRTRPALSESSTGGLESSATVAAAALLARILARTGLSAPPIIQLIPCTIGQRASPIALGLAVAAANHIGRTLLMDASEPWHAKVPPIQGEKNGTTLPTVRDVFVPALHHSKLRTRLVDRTNSAEEIRTSLQDTAKGFRFLTLDCLSGRESAHGLSLASFCSGTILVVQAGRTTMAEVSAASRDIAASQGRIIGTVLTRLPAALPAWFGEGYVE